MLSGCICFVVSGFEKRIVKTMGGKDSPPPCVSASPVQSSKWDKQRSESEKNVFSRQPSPIEYVPRSKSEVNFQIHWKSESQSRSLPRDCNYSPIRTYMECLSPRSLKCVLVGDSGVGKTSMLMSYTVDKFPEKHAPTIYDKFSTSLSVNGKRISLTLCDTAGQNDFAHLRPLCYPQVDVAIICFSVVDMLSYENAKTKWVKEIRRYCPGVPVIFVGTQVDQRENPTVLKEMKSQGKKCVSKSDGNKLVSLCKATSYVECSALTQFNIKGAFDEAIAIALELNTSSRKHTPQCAGCTIL